MEHIVDALSECVGIYHVAVLENLRDGSTHVFGTMPIPGVIEIPSVHAAASIMVVYACRNNHILLALSVAYTLFATASVPLFGGHYFIALIAGAVIAIIACTGSFYYQRRYRQQWRLQQ